MCNFFEYKNFSFFSADTPWGGFYVVVCDTHGNGTHYTDVFMAEWLALLAAKDYIDLGLDSPW